MAKYAGLVGYATQAEVSPGVWENVITSRKMRGDILQSNSSFQETDLTVHNNFTLNNQFSLVADPYSKANYMDMVYVTHAGRKWKVTGVQLVRPRLIVQVGGIYNGPIEQTTAP